MSNQLLLYFLFISHTLFISSIFQLSFLISMTKSFKGWDPMLIALQITTAGDAAVIQPFIFKMKKNNTSMWNMRILLLYSLIPLTIYYSICPSKFVTFNFLHSFWIFSTLFTILLYFLFTLTIYHYFSKMSA